MTYVYWMVEFVQMRRDVKKEYLDEVIDPKHLQLNKPYLEDRIKEIWPDAQGSYRHIYPIDIIRFFF